MQRQAAADQNLISTDNLLTLYLKEPRHLQKTWRKIIICR